jgi:hypothetical protein
LKAQENPTPKWNAHLSIGQYTASIGTPTFSPLHLGIQTGVNYRWNKNTTHQFVQSANLGYFYHEYLQHAIQLYSEIGYELHLKNGLQINPLSIGGGYVLSILDMNTVIFDETTQQFETVRFPTNHNFVISLGGGLGYTSKLSIQDRPITFLLDYRLQIQGIMMRNNVPFVAYTPLILGISMPL